MNLTTGDSYRAICLRMITKFNIANEYLAHVGIYNRIISKRYIYDVVKISVQEVISTHKMLQFIQWRQMQISITINLLLKLINKYIINNLVRCLRR